MTAVLGYADGTTVWIGGDSAVQNGSWARASLSERKVFRCGSVLIGVAGMLRTMQVIRTSFVPPEHPQEPDDLDYLIRIFVPVFEQCLKDHNVSMKDSESFTSCLLGYRGKLYRLSWELAVNCYLEQSWSIGNGGDYALGAFAILHAQGAEVVPAMLQALEVAHRFDLTVDAPYYVESI